MTREEFFDIINVGSVVKIKNTTINAKAIKVVSKDEWLANTTITWDPHNFLEFLYIGGKNNGVYDGWRWNIIENNLDLEPWKRPVPKQSTKTIDPTDYCSCSGPAKQSSMLFGDIFYICTVCRKEKRK